MCNLQKPKDATCLEQVNRKRHRAESLVLPGEILLGCKSAGWHPQLRAVTASRFGAMDFSSGKVLHYKADVSKRVIALDRVFRLGTNAVFFVPPLK